MAHAVRSNHDVINKTEQNFFTFIHDRIIDLWFTGSVTLDFIKQFYTITLWLDVWPLTSL